MTPTPAKSAKFLAKDGTQTAQSILTDAEISALELATRSDIDGDGTKAFQFQNELLNSAGSNFQRLRLAQTSAGLVLSDNSRGIIAGDDISNFPTSAATNTSNTSGVIQLLDPDFSISTDDNPVYARRLVEWQSTPQIPAGSAVATGYELYTNNAGTVTRHSFDIDGSLTSSDELSATARVTAEMQVGVDLTSGSGAPSISINNKIAGTMPPKADARALYETNAGLLVAISGALDTQPNPFSASTAPTANTENQATLLLDQSGTTAFSVPGGNSTIKAVVGHKEISRINNGQQHKTSPATTSLPPMVQAPFNSSPSPVMVSCKPQTPSPSQALT